MATTARTLGGIEEKLAPASERLVETAAGLETLAAQLRRMATVFAERFDPMDQSAAHFEEAVKQLNFVSTRVLDELGSRDGG